MSNSKSTIWPPDESAYKKIIFKLLFQNQIQECSGSVVECLTQDRWPPVRASPASLRCVLEQDTLILA